MIEFFNRLPRLFSLGLLFPVIFLNAWLLFILFRQLEPLVSTLISATLIAFLLDYPIRFLQQRGVNRTIAASVVLLLFVLVLSLLGLFLGPLILRQANELLTRLPEWIKSGQQQLQSLETWAQAQQFPVDLSSTLNELVARVTLLVRSLTSQVVSLLFSAIGSIVNVFLSLVFTIFLVMQGEKLWSGILGWLPSNWSQQIRETLPQNFERYIAGQLTIATIIAIAQTTTLLLLRVPLAQLFGFGIGVASLIPFGGTTTIIVVSSLLALQNFWLGVKVLAIAVVVNQIIENILSPRILGDLTGLNPIWMLISLDVGVKLGGFLGLVVAVPIASFIKAIFDSFRAARFNWQLTTVTPEVAVDPPTLPPAPEPTEVQTGV